MIASPAVTRAVARMDGTAIVVRCVQPQPGELGELTIGRTILLAPTICHQLAEFRAGRVTFATAEAVLVLTHEAEHARGFSNETDTECRAIIDAPHMASLLGRPAGPHLRSLLLAVHRWVRTSPGYGDHPC